MKITITLNDYKYTDNIAPHNDIIRILTPDRDALIMEVKDMISQGRTQRWIANELGIAVGTVNKYSKL